MRMHVPYPAVLARALALALGFGGFGAGVAASPPSGELPVSEFRARRSEAMRRMPDGILLLPSISFEFAGDQVFLHGFQQRPNFYYFTGLASASGAVLAIDGAAKETWLFVPKELPRFNALLERARIEPGADEIVNELLGRSRVQRQARIVVTLPAEQITPGIAKTLHAALRRYCEARLARVQRETQVAWRQGLRSLGTGSILFVVGLLLSSGFLQPDVPEFWQNLLGNGVFLVIGWVGLWYPLDLLFFARQPLKREALIVQAISRMPLSVQPADVP